MKKIKIIKIIAVFSIFALSFISHELFNLIPNNIIGAFFPIDESIIEHIKMIFNTYLIYSLIELIILKIFKQETTNFVVNVFISNISLIIIFMFIWYPIYINFGENIIITLTTYFISISISQIISYFLYKTKNNKIINTISFIVLLLIELYFVKMN